NYFTGRHENEVAGVEYREGHTKDIATLVPETPDLVYHLGEYSRVAESLNEPERVWDFNIVGTAAVLEFCRARGCKIVYIGSSTKFADAREDGTAGRDLSPYTWSKAVNTELVRNYHAWYGVPYATAYFYNVYGPRELAGKYGTVIEIYRQAYLAGEPLKVNAPGTQRRIYTHINDTVEALALIGEKGEGDEYGIGSNDDFAIREVAELFGGPIEMMPARRTSRPSANVDTSKVKGLGWKQQHTLREYVDAFLAEHPKQ
ncbi:MAG TPA: NAD-dependent epimerase/dehydratase family protein, partial [Candidatus Paceibacterota bacterium]|nr:NAD-dependent epimerase/dehydratase family protein [Candidatus Paceibacterota bacterium]